MAVVVETFFVGTKVGAELLQSFHTCSTFQHVTKSFGNIKLDLSICHEILGSMHIFRGFLGKNCRDILFLLLL